MNERTFLICDHCKNLVGLISDGGGQMLCCGQPMRALIPGQADAAAEKHVPVCVKSGGELTVNVGSADHPMSDEHLIEWIAVCGKNFMQRIILEVDAPASAQFVCPPAGDLTVYAYCNLHGLWSAVV